MTNPNRTVPGDNQWAGGGPPTVAPDLAHIEERPGLRLTGPKMRELGRPFRMSIIEIAALGVAVTATRVAQALLVARVVGHVLHGSGTVGPSIVAIAVLGAVRLGLVWRRDRRAASAASAARQHLRTTLFARLAELGPGYMLRRRTGAVETALVGSVERLGSYYGEFVPLAVASTISVVVVLVGVAVLDPLTALAMAAAAALVPLAPVLTARAFGQAGRQFSESFGRVASEYLDAIQGLVTLKVFNASRRWGRRLGEQCEELSADATALGGLANMHVGFVSLGMAGGTVLGVALAIMRATNHALATAALIPILLLARECFGPLGDLQAAFPGAYLAVSAANPVIELLDATSEVPEPARPMFIDRAAVRPSVTFDRVSFAYRPDHRAALRDVTFEVSPGETVALVGPSGAGKTTVVSLLLRFFDPSGGAIRVDGHDIRDMALADLRSLVAVTFQDSYLFHRSVAENLLLARPDAGVADVEAAARAANAHDFIAALPDGYDTVVGERGTRLSGGERQRLAIARALLADTPILVLDEPTSSVDAASETLITAAIERLTAGRTTIVIAHRLSTVARADRVIVLDAGHVVEAGLPGELRGAGGVFSRLVEAQELTR